MIEKLKQHPLVGLTFAITAAYVLAHLVNRVGDNLYENKPDLLIGLVIAVAVLSVIAWKRNWFAHHWRKFAFGFGSMVLLYCMAAAVIMIRHPDRFKTQEGPITLDQSKAVPIDHPFAPATDTQDRVKDEKRRDLLKRLGTNQHQLK